MGYYQKKSPVNFLMAVVSTFVFGVFLLVKYPEWFGALCVLGLGVYLFARWRNPKGYLGHSPGVSVSSLRRMRRGTFFLWSLGIGMVAALPAAFAQKEANEEIRMIGQIISWGLYSFSAITVNQKRLHDFGKSGWWALLQFIPGVGLGLWVYLISTKGDYGRNKYGLDPRGATQAVAPSKAIVI